MANEVTILVRADDKASGALDKLHGTAGKLGSMLGGALKAGAIAGGAAVAGLGVASLKMALDFEKSFAEVKTLLPQVSEQGFKKLQADLLDFSKEMGIATDKAIPALYQAISAGVPADNVISFMETAAKLSVGGVTSLETAVDGLSSVVNAYGANVLGAGKASDIMFTAVKLGKTTADELSSSLFNVVPTASALGISFEEVAAALATMTVQGVPTKIATTQLRQAFVEASKSGTELDKAIRELSGKSFAELVKSGKTGASILEELRQSMPEQEFKDLFGSVEAMNAVLQITGPNAALMGSNLEAMGGAAGATDAAFKTMAETASFKLNKAINELKVILMEVGLKALPVLMTGFDKVSAWLTAHKAEIDAFLQGFKEFVAANVIPALAAAFKQLGQFIEGAIPVIAAVLGFLKEHKEVAIALGVVLLALALAFGGPVIAIAALGAALVLLLAHWDDIRKMFEVTIPDAIDSVITKIKELPIIGEIFQAAFAAAFIVIKTMFGIIKIEVETAINVIRDIIKIVTALIHGDWDEAWKGIKQLVSDIWDGIKGIVDLQIKAIKGLLKVEINLIVGILGDAWDLVEGKVKSIWKDIKDFLEGAVTGVKQFFKNNWPEIATIISGPFAPLVLLATDAFGVRSALEGAMMAVKQFVSDRIGDVVDAFKAMPGLLTAMIGAFYDAGSSLADAVVRGLKTIGEEAWDIGRAFANAIISVMNQAIQAINDAIPDEINLPAPLPNIDLPDNPIPLIPYLARGGIVRRPTLAMLGEAGPEAVVPLGTAGNSMSAPITININISALDGESVRRVIPELTREMDRHLKRVGLAGLA